MLPRLHRYGTVVPLRNDKKWPPRPVPSVKMIKDDPKSLLVAGVDGINGYDELIHVNELIWLLFDQPIFGKCGKQNHGLAMRHPRCSPKTSGEPPIYSAMVAHFTQLIMVAPMSFNLRPCTGKYS